MAAPALLLATLYNRLSTLQEGLEAAGWSVVACSEPREALERLQTTPLQAVFCDEYLRGASPAGLLAWSRRVAPNLPFYLFAMRSDRARFAGPHEPDLVLPFPPRPEQLPRPPSDAVANVAAPVALPLQGDLSLLPLASILDMMGIAGQSGVLVVEGACPGSITIERGKLRHVETGSGQLGVRALADLLRAPSGTFRVEPYRAPKRATLAIAAATALTEAARLADEMERDRALVEAARAACPSASGLAAGYPHASTPSCGAGDARTAFDRGRRLLEAARGAAENPTHLCVEGGDGAVALLVYGEGNLLAAYGPTGQSLRLMAGLAQALRSLPRS